MKPAQVVAVDPGYKGGVAIFEDGEFVSSMSYDVSNATDKNDACRKLAAQFLCKTEGRRVMVIEQQFQGKNPFGYKRIIESRMAWEGIAMEMGYEVMQVYPVSWQSRVCNIKGKLEKEDRYKAYIRVAELLSGKALPVDQAAAYCIGMYFLGEDDYRQRTGSGYPKAEKKKKKRVAKKPLVKAGW